jgi:serine protease inhibitor
VSCVIVLPDEVGGDSRLISGMTGEKFNEISGGMGAKEVMITLPKVKIETRFSANAELQRLGMVRVFGGGGRTGCD